MREEREPGQANSRSERREGIGRGWGAPRNFVVVVLAAVLIGGGGRKFLQWLRERRAVGRLRGPAVTPEDVLEAAGHGRGGLMDLFRLLDSGPTPEIRWAAGRALARLWADDQLVAEEEKAIVGRGYTVTWRARRRYPRAVRGPVPVAAAYDVPFLREGPGEVAPTDLEWSHRVLGAERVALQEFSAWRAGPGRVEFTLDPENFPGSGPHRLILQVRVRTRPNSRTTGRSAGPSETWELELPHVAISVEFDPRLTIEALLTLPDEARAQTIARAVRLEPPPTSGADPGTFQALDLVGELALRDPPVLMVMPPLPCDLAHSLAVEFEGIPARYSAGGVILSGQGTSPTQPLDRRCFPLGPIVGLSPGVLDRPGDYRVRAWLIPDPDRGWTDPEVRSIWPESIVTDWVTVRVIRR